MSSGLDAGVTRRAALRWLGNGGVTALAVQGSVATQDGPSTAEGGAIPVVRAWIDAWNSDDPATNVAALYADDGVYVDTPSSQEVPADELAGFLEGYLAGVADVRLEPDTAFGAGTWAVVEYAFSGTSQGNYGGSTGPFSVRTVTILEHDGDAIRRSTDYYDLITILDQLNQPPSDGTPTP